MSPRVLKPTGRWRRLGWYCPSCHHVFAHAFMVTGGARFHNQDVCGQPMVRVRLEEVA